jgi:two-component system cell cycle sensor histidine kinase/response regulator CckA
MGDSFTGTEAARFRELERRLAESERRLEDSQRLARVGNWEWDLTELRSTWSKELLRIFGRDPEGPQPELTELIAAVHPDDRGEFEEFVAGVRTTPGGFEQSYRIVNAAGETRYLQARGMSVGGEGGVPVRAFGTTQDITELKRSEQDLRLRVEQQAAVSALGRYALSAADLGALMDEAVRVIATVLRVDLAEVMELDEEGEAFRVKAGVGWEPGTVGQVVSARCERLAHALREGVALVEDYESEDRFPTTGILRRHGARSGIAVAIEGADFVYGTIGAHSTSVRRFSVDDAHFVQAVGNVLSAAIERDRVRQLEAQLEQAQRLEAVGQLAGGVAHDFNNLLLVILANTESLLAKTEDEDALAGMREVERAATSAADLTRQLLQFSRRDPSELSGVDLASKVRETEALLRRTIGEHIDLRVDVAAGLPLVGMAPGQLDQVLVNLVVNARDAINQGGTIEVSVVPSGQQAVLIVRDDGEGMSEEVVARAFDPFFTTKPRGQGTGLGLATVYGIVNQIGGAVEIDSAPGRGTAVRVALPVATTARPAVPEAEPVDGPSGAGNAILVVDNERAVRAIVCRMLRKHGYATYDAASGADAERMLENGAGEVDLLLTDVLMPGISGHELVERARRSKPSLKAIYMSGYSGGSSPLDLRNGDDNGDEVLEKPFTAAQLVRAVGRVLA